MKKIGYYLLGLILKGLLILSTFLPHNLICRLSQEISSLYLRFSHHYRRRIKKNLDLAFGPSFDGAKAVSIKNTLAKNLGQNFAETLISATSKRKDILSKIAIQGGTNLDQALAKGKGVLAFSAHLGNFTLIGIKMFHAGYPFSMLVKEPHYKGIAGAIRLLQRQQGGRFIYVEPWGKALKEILACLRKNEIVCLLADEKKRRSGIYVDFFGHPAPTATGLAVLSLRTGAPLVPIFIIRHNDGSQQICIEPPLEFTLNGHRSEDIAIITNSFTKTIENYVRMYPEQWFWINNRWKKRTKTKLTTA